LSEASEAAGPIEILVNNAGAAQSAPFTRTGEALWRAMFSVNLDAAYHACQVVLPAMREAGYGRIVNIASTAALRGYAYTTAYCAAKHGLLGLTRALAIELARTGITVNAVCPGFTDTDLTRTAIDNITTSTGRDQASARASLTAFNPQGRLVTPAEVANAVLWLCRPGSEAITAQAIAVAGGEVT
jgi:anthraniloyl-CoA monooxygenase